MYTTDYTISISIKRLHTASGSIIRLDEQHMSMVSLLVNVLLVTVIVGIVVASESHHCFGVNVEAAVHKYSC